MAGLGSAWGSREEFLHPRDKHGRFRKKWKMAEGVIDAISNFLDRFSPRTFQSDGQASQYLFNRAKPGRFGGGTQYSRLHADYDEANQHLRAGDIDPPTQKFIKMMDDSSVNLDSDIILSRTMGPEAFGLSPQQMDLEDGGIEDFTGRLIADRGYSAANIGTPMSHGPGKVTMSIAVPKGAKVVIPARSQSDRGIFLDRNQELRITKVKSDGRGGWYMLAVATPRTPGETPEPLDRGPRGVGLSPQEREARVRGVQGRQAKREGIRTDAEINAEEIQRGTQQVKREQPAELPPAQGAPQQPATPGGPPPRNEPVLKDSVGGADTAGKGTAEIAQTPPPEASTPEAPAAPVRNFREAVREAGVPSPSAGPRRQQWNKAYLGVASGKKDPGDMLRELDRDIDYFKRVREDRRSSGTEDPELDGDIDAMEKLADVISRESGVERSKAPAPAPAKAAATPIAQAPGERRRELPGEAGTRPLTGLKEFKAQKNQEIADREERKRRLLSPPPETPPPAPVKAPAKKATVTNLAEARAQKLTPEQRREVSDLSPEEQNSYRGFRGKGMTHEDALQSARDAVGTRNAREAERANKALAKKAAPSPAAAPAPAAGTPTRLRPRDIKVGDTIPQTRGLPGRSDDQSQPSKVVARIDKVRGRFAFFDKDGNEISNANPNSYVWRRGEGPTVSTPEPVRVPPVPASRREAGEVSIPKNPEDLPRAPVSKLQDGDIAIWNPPGEDPVYGRVVDLGLRKFVDWEGGRREPLNSARGSKNVTFHREGATPASTPDILAQLKAEDANNVPTLTREQAAELVAPLRKAQLVEMAKELNIPSPSSKTVPELKGRIVEATVGLRRDSIATRGFTGRRPGEGGLPGRPGSMVPAAEPNAPAAQKPVQAPDRREAFAEAWTGNERLVRPPTGVETAAHRSAVEVRDDVLAGRITPDEGIRRLENDIDFNKQDLAEIEAEIRGESDPGLRSKLVDQREKLRGGIRYQEDASSLMRTHFRKAPPVTPQEIELEVEPEVKEVIDKLTPQQLRDQARVAGYGQLKGSNKQELLQDLLLKMVTRQEGNRTKKAVKKLAPAPLVTKKSGDPDYVDARALAEGLGMDTSDQKMLDAVQEMLDGGGRFNERPKTPAAAGRELEIMANGAGGPYWERVVHHQVSLEKIQDQIAGKTPSPFTPDELQEHLKEAQARDLALKQSGDRWLALAERLQKTRRRPARKATEPAPEKPKLTPEEKKVTAQAADVLGVPKEQLQKQALAKKTSAAPAPEAAKSAVDTMRTMQSREEGQAFLKNRTKGELQEIAKAGNISYGSKDTKQKITDQIVQWTIGRRLDSEAISRPAPPRFGEDKPQLENMAPSELADLEAELGIKRTSLDRGERIAAIRAKQSGQVPERKAGPKPEGEPVKSRRAPYVDVRGGPVAKRDRPLADEPVYLPNGGADQGLVHFDSELGQLWQNLYMDDREPNSFVNEIARIGDGVGSKGEGRIGLEEALNRLRALKKEAVDKAIEDRIQETINALDSPKVSLPDLPDTVPASVIRALKELADIPTARRTGKIGSARLDESILNKKIDIVRQIDAGKFRLGEPESKLRNRDLHENADGATTMWSIFEQLLNMPRKLPDDKPNPEWIELRDWLRGRHLQR